MKQNQIVEAARIVRNLLFYISENKLKKGLKYTRIQGGKEISINVSKFNSLKPFDSAEVTFRLFEESEENSAKALGRILLKSKEFGDYVVYGRQNYSASPENKNKIIFLLGDLPLDYHSRDQFKKDHLDQYKRNPGLFRPRKGGVFESIYPALLLELNDDESGRIKISSRLGVFQSVFHPAEQTAFSESFLKSNCLYRYSAVRIYKELDDLDGIDNWHRQMRRLSLFNLHEGWPDTVDMKPMPRINETGIILPW